MHKMTQAEKRTGRCKLYKIHQKRADHNRSEDDEIQEKVATTRRGDVVVYKQAVDVHPQDVVVLLTNTFFALGGSVCSLSVARPTLAAAWWGRSS